MKTISERVAVMQHFAAGGKVEFKRIDGDRWGSISTPTWNWLHSDYRIAEIDPYAELKKAAADPTKQIRVNVANAPWYDSTSFVVFTLSASHYEIRDKPKKVKLLAWFTGERLVWVVEEYTVLSDWKRVPSEDKEIEVADD